ncbi:MULTISPECIES: glycoside hydrolase [Brevibacillus]|uniref:glycoside hydrolase n=1 Tax=Brevibacillus TaxID=55080 RepID=UPI000ED35391|nr:glycoside hydrolase [Brevibacillus sp.]HBZ80295.1 hypothetical protein [Brevibacillus sp.]
MKRHIPRLIVLALLLQMASGCESTAQVQQTFEQTGAATAGQAGGQKQLAKQPEQALPFSFEVKPETFELFVESGGSRERASEPLPARRVENLHKSEQEVSWNYPDDKLQVKIAKEADHLQISLTSTGAESFSWPQVKAQSYMLPLGEGKWIPAADKAWQSFLREESLAFSESFSMRFFALNQEKFAIFYMVDNMFNNTLDFAADPAISMQFTHEFPSINPDKSYSFRLYVTENDPVQIAGLYKQIIQNQGEFTTLAQKAAANPNVEKLYGAPHFYIWNKTFLAEDDVKWAMLAKKLGKDFTNWLVKLLADNKEDGQESIAQLKEIMKQDYVAAYQRKAILNGFNYALRSRDFYNPQLFAGIADSKAKALIAKGVEQLDEVELYELNKRLLKSVLQDAVPAVEQWGDTDSLKLLQKMQQAGIARAWIGLPDWTAAYMKPAFIGQANDAGYLIATYDSYHSIHKEENPDWNTAIFADKSLYEKATIAKKNGEKKGGFLQRGRLLNPTLSLPSVKQRMSEIMGTGVRFNSWFIDVDAAGEFHDDYSKEHTTTQQQDMQAKLARMNYIRDEWDMVIGSETGNDFASGSIAYAHGIETPVIRWSDPDMRQNKTSPYYVGGYWSPAGEIPERYAKQVPLKDEYRHVYLDPAYSLPLFKLVYNESVITSHHWEWGSLKIKGEVGTRMLGELLYNVPPLYHLDNRVWESNKETIMRHLQVWTPFHQKAVQRPMTDFAVLTKDRLVQKAVYGQDLQVIVNYSSKDFTYENKLVKAKSALIIDGSITRTFQAGVE